MWYSDMRLEVNKLSTVDHQNIVQFLGLCVVSFSILLEWAPKGNLDQMIDEHRIADTWICPDVVAQTVHQVCKSLHGTFLFIIICCLYTVPLFLTIQ